MKGPGNECKPKNPHAVKKKEKAARVQKSTGECRDRKILTDSKKIKKMYEIPLA